MPIKIQNKKGHVIVEAAIFLPIFIIALITIGYVLRGIGMTETVMHCLSNQGRKLSIEGYIKDKSYDTFLQEGESSQSENLKKAAAEWVSQETFYWRVQHQLEEEVGSKIHDLDLVEYQEDYTQGDRDALTKVSFEYHLPIPVLPVFASELNLQETLVLRSFIGKNSYGKTRSFSSMEEKESLQTVYVFPRAGERYHNKNCRVLRDGAKKVILNSKIKKKYGPCKLCHPELLSTGSFVYIFEGSGEAYHKKSCASIERFFVSMEKEEAEDKGYTPCHICGGK
ncbi:hypothetical protein [Sinanaerobacter sp. ZZT-01]|uniref:hypothetical protein n=1 Tax=Sinanaerobacter sp. ZZT-01 TaxID=3111540 RepID=UPI002D7839C8|nr:hypothetical protein [Sinanaerobacter sp. ZZT-01]WRR92903.1 hypothetical protein U5921_12800 [Sinanaerobacter sp. ZZT-01]